MASSPLTARILPIRTNIKSDDASITSSQSGDESICPPFPNDEALDAFVSALVLLQCISSFFYVELLLIILNNFDL